jgi:hypothetical protein
MSSVISLINLGFINYGFFWTYKIEKRREGLKWMYNRIFWYLWAK